jgi:hypothetical protein
MSVPSWVMMPVRGARNPILSSCAWADAVDAPAAATHSNGSTRVSLFMVGPLYVTSLLFKHLIARSVSF